MKFKTVEDAIERANNTTFGLAAGVCTKNVQVGLKIARALRAGAVWFNCFNNVDAGVPFGGYKEVSLNLFFHLLSFTDLLFRDRVETGAKRDLMLSKTMSKSRAS